MTAPSVSSVSPTGGPTTGGTSVAITGTNFTGATAVAFGGTPATSFTVNSGTQITALSPARPAGPARVSVSNPDGASTQAVFFTYQTAPVPSVSSVNPTNGSTAGGTTVTITGTNFTGATAVTFGGTPAAGFTVDSATQITALTPPHAAGAAQIVVTSPAGSSTQPVSFTFQAPTFPTITSLNPGSGPTAGGTTVIITGTNFTGATAVTFGGTPAAGFTVDSATQITALTPPHAAGGTQVTVTTAVGTSNIAAFFYIDVPVITGLSPVIGPSTGSNTVTINGTNLAAVTAVTFGSASTAFTITNSTEILATAPSAPPGTSFVPVATFSSGGASNSVLYNYVPIPVITAVSPDSGPEMGGNQVMISGSALGFVSAVSFGDTLAPFSALSGNQILATAAPGTGTVQVVVTTPGGTSNGLAYTHVAPP